jgi:hypothetical protein
MPEGIFDPAEVELLVAAYDRVCRTLSLADESDPLRTIVAMKVIYVARRGVRDPEDLYFQALQLVVENF